MVSSVTRPPRAASPLSWVALAAGIYPGVSRLAHFFGKIEPGNEPVQRMVGQNLLKFLNRSNVHTTQEEVDVELFYLSESARRDGLQLSAGSSDGGKELGEAQIFIAG